MLNVLNRLLPPSLVVLHAILFTWALVGLVEWSAPRVPWPSISNVLFPRWVLLVHWLAVLTAALLFLVGYTLRWPRTPVVMIPAYAFMAVVCTIETVVFLNHPLRFVAMALEFAAYAAILVSIRRVPALAVRFRQPPAQRLSRQQAVGAGTL